MDKEFSSKTEMYHEANAESHKKKQKRFKNLAIASIKQAKKNTKMLNKIILYVVSFMKKSWSNSFTAGILYNSFCF